MDEIVTFLRVAKSNVKRFEKAILAKEYATAIEGLKAIIAVIEKREKSIDFCPSLIELKDKAIELILKAEKEQGI